MERHELTMNEMLELTYKRGKAISGSDREMLPIFNENGEQIGIAPRLLCHRLGLVHKVVYLFVMNQKKELLLQIRGDGRIDVPVGGHVSDKDISEKMALKREIFEELGLSVDENKVEYMVTYFREAEINIQKPEESNRELRVLYLYKMNEEEENSLRAKFQIREEQKAVLDVQWVSLDRVLSCCDKSMAADGLKASLPHYLKIAGK